MAGNLSSHNYRIVNVLVAYQGKEMMDHPGVFEGFEGAVQKGLLKRHTSMFWRQAQTSSDWEDFWGELCERVSSEHIDWVLLHHFHDRHISVGDALVRLRRIRPQVRIATSLGDPFCRFIHRVPRQFVEAAQMSDIVFLTGFGYLAEQLARAGVRNMVLMPLGYCQSRFGQTEAHQWPEKRDGIVFVGNRRLGRNPTHELFWNGLKRIRLVELLDRRYGRRFHLYGTGWGKLPSARGVLPFDQQGSTYASAEVVFGGFPGVTYEYYTSNRHFIAMSEGAIMVDYWVDGVERLLCPNAHWLLFRTEKELIRRIDSVLEGGAEDAWHMAQLGMERVRKHFTQKRLIEDMIEIWRDFDMSRSECGMAPIPQLPYVLPEFSGERRSPLFVRNWLG
jgi:hypothetical protein